MLQLFSYDVYYLLDLGSTLSYVTLFVAVYFGFILKYLSDPFLFLPRWGTLWLTEESIGAVWYLLVVERL